METSVEVSAMALGTMFFGAGTDEETSRALLDRYVEAGGRLLDTANCYAHWKPGCVGGESESLLGRWMRDRGNRRELFVCTKVAFDYRGSAQMPGAKRGLRAEQIEAECSKSLRRLGIEAIDLYYAHHDDRGTPLEETLAAFDRLVRAGKVRFIGESNYQAWRLVEALGVSRAGGLARYVCAQQRHTYLRPRPGADFSIWPPANPELMDACRTHDVTIVAYSPLLRGAYTRPDRPIGDKYAGPDSDARLAALKAVAAEKNATPNQVVLAWMMHADPPVIPLFSASTLEQLSEDLGALDVALTAEDMARLNEASG